MKHRSTNTEHRKRRSVFCVLCSVFCSALLLVLPLRPYLFSLSSAAPAITDSDEAYYAESAREMIESGDWITPRYNYAVRFEKPILFYWMIAATLGRGGGEVAARFWAAMSGVGLVLVASAIGRRWLNEDAVLHAGTITATSFATAAMARQSLPDLPLAFFVTVAVWCGFEALAQGTSARPPLTRRWWLVVRPAARAGGPHQGTGRAGAAGADRRAGNRV